MRQKSPPGGVIAALAFVAVAFAVSLAVILSSLRADLPQIPGVSYPAILTGLALLVFAFAIYSIQRERSLTRLTQDLTDKRVEAAEASARASQATESFKHRETLQAVLHTSSDGVLIVDNRRRVVSINPALSTLVGINEYRAKDLRCEEILSCRDRGELACGKTCPFEQVLDTGETVKDRVFEAGDGAGRRVHLSASFAPIKDAQEKVTMAAGSFIDQSRQAQVQQLQDDFTTVVSHELRGPLQSLKGLVGGLARSDTSPREGRREYLTQMNTLTDGLNNLVEELLATGRLEAKSLKLSFAETDLETLISKAADKARSQWPARTVTVMTDPVVPNVRADSDAVATCLHHLLDNALRYSQGEVRVTLSHDRHAAIVEVEDFGPGFSPSEAVSIFEKFRRVSRPQDNDKAGAGLGLFISRRLIEAHGGRLTTTSSPGIGSTFEMRIPFAGAP